MQSSDSPTIDASDLQTELLRVLTSSSAKTLSAPEIAQAVASGGNWHGLLMPIRRAAIALAQAGRLIIYRHGKPVDPADFKGVYRLGLPRHD